MQDSSIARRLDGLVVEAGMVHGMSTNSISDPHKHWATDIWAECLLKIHGGPNDGVVLRIGGNTVQTITTVEPFQSFG